MNEKSEYQTLKLPLAFTGQAWKGNFLRIKKWKTYLFLSPQKIVKQKSVDRQNEELIHNVLSVYYDCNYPETKAGGWGHFI